MSVHVSTCSKYDFNALPTSSVEVVGAEKTCVFIRLFAEMSDWYLEKRINIKICV
jgi:hypothetical protein